MAQINLKNLSLDVVELWDGRDMQPDQILVVEDTFVAVLLARDNTKWSNPA